MAHRHILNVLESDRRLVNDPDPTSKPQAVARHYVPCRVVAQVDGDVRDDIGNDGDKQSGDGQDDSHEWSGHGYHNPCDQDQHVDGQQPDPELQLQVPQETLGRTK